MGDTVRFQVPLGYRIASRTKHVNLSEAQKILITRKQRYYTKAVRLEDGADLVSNYVICPHCGAEFVSNTGYFLKGEKYSKQGARVPKEKIYDWSAMQISFFDKEKSVLHISNPTSVKGSFSCPKCTLNSKFSKKIRNVEISNKDRKVKIKSELCLEEIIFLNWLEYDKVAVEFPMYETAEFDLEKGIVLCGLEDKNGILLSERDVTEYPRLLKNGAIYNVVTYNKKINRTLKNMFRKLWGSELPYASKEITLENLFKMTMFVGYNKDFYTVIPYKFNTLHVDETFSSDAKLLRHAEKAVEIYGKSNLPDVKSVRRIFFKNPGMLFYIKEVEMLWNILSDHNSLCSFLEIPNIYELLSDMHLRPGIIYYMVDYCRVKGIKSFMEKSKTKWREIRNQAIDYCCVDERMRKIIRDAWKSKRKTCSISKTPYSIPMYRPYEQIKDCTINGYHFFWLRNSNDYAVAGEMLDNCLGNFEADNFPVVCVKKNQKYVAAIQISGDMIVQAYGYNNMPISSDIELEMVYNEWKKRYDLKVTDFDDFDDEDFDLAF